MNRHSNIVMGAVFIAIGSLFLLSNLGFVNFSWNYIWPLALLIPGVYLHFAFFSGIDKNPGILVPAGILTSYGALFYANVLLKLHIGATMFPLFIIGIAIGLLELYLFGTRDKGLLIPVFILGGLGVSMIMRSYLNFNLKDYLIPGLLILVGVLIITKKDPSKG